ncbi:MAG TPA: cytochrome c, partial [Candidatus Binatia bacterium]|nr:cytochrome c [Candidatus Binatia bacterium]
MALTDYIGGDYKNAIQAGKIVNQDEYQEMLEFASRSLEILNQLKAREGRDSAGIEKDLQALASYIKQKSDEKLVSELAQQIKDRLIAAYKVITYPKAVPTSEAGRTVYTQNCAQCHGATGRGDGPGVQAMQPKEPKPANFTDTDLMNGLSPFKAFNTTTFGVEGTAMPSFSALSEEERWEAAFYIFSLRFSAEAADNGKKLLQARKPPEELKNIANLATSSDEELERKLRTYFPSEQESFKALAYLRWGVLEERTDDPLLIARTLLSEAMGLYEKGEKEKAYQKAVEAYLEGFELAEPALFARNLSFGRDLESKITSFRSALRRGDAVGEVRKLYQEIDAGLTQASQLLSSANQLADIYIFLNASLIILREGLEAALVLAAILAFLR